MSRNTVTIVVALIGAVATIMTAIIPGYFQNNSKNNPSAIGESKDKPWPPFMGGLTLPVGQNSKGIWQYFVKNQAYIVENRQNPEAVNYFYAKDNIHEGWRDIVVKVQVESDQDTTAGAGLIYALDPQKTTYYIYSLGTNGEISFYKRVIGSQNLEILCSEKPNIDMQQFNELRIVERDQKIEMYFNGKVFNTCADKKIGKGFSGIVAYGTGRFRFTDFNYIVSK